MYVHAKALERPARLAAAVRYLDEMWVSSIRQAQSSEAAPGESHGEHANVSQLARPGHAAWRTSFPRLAKRRSKHDGRVACSNFKLRGQSSSCMLGGFGFGHSRGPGGYVRFLAVGIARVDSIGFCTKMHEPSMVLKLKCSPKYDRALASSALTMSLFILSER